MGFIHLLTRYIPKLTQTAAASYTLLNNTEKNKPIVWKMEHNTALSTIIKFVSEITQIKHSDQHLDNRAVCDAFTSSLEPSLEQHSPERWVAKAYAPPPRFTN